MKKYLFIFKSEVMTNLQYIFNLVSHFFAFFVMVFIFMNLWNYMYDDPSELINGYTKNQMIWYVIITEMMWFIVGGRKACQKIAGEVKAGSIAYSMNKPYIELSENVYKALFELKEFNYKYIYSVAMSKDSFGGFLDSAAVAGIEFKGFKKIVPFILSKRIKLS